MIVLIMNQLRTSFLLAFISGFFLISNVYGININFQPESNADLLDYFTDSGQRYSLHENGYTYGWDEDISYTTRNRNSSRSADERFDTLIHMQLPRDAIDAVWEIALPDGNYQIRLVAGDPSYLDGRYQIMAEGIPIIDGIPDTSQYWFDETRIVSVNDGRLTLSSGLDALSNKLSFIEITADEDLFHFQPVADVFDQTLLVDEQQLFLSWDYSLFNVAGVLVLMSQDVVTAAPATGKVYSAGDMIADSKVIYAGSDKQILVNHLENNRSYHFKIFAYNASHQYSPGIMMSGTPATLTTLENKQAVAAMSAQLKKGVSADVIEGVFGFFARTHFGAEQDPLIYQRFGYSLTFLTEGDWSHISQHSASFSWQTNLPARSYVEYGKTSAYGQRTSESDRYYSLHLHYLKDLEINTRYHYRLVSVDERGNILYSEDRSFTTATDNNVIFLPGKQQNLPYVLDQDGMTYVLNEDINAPLSAFDIQADNITLDLGGHTISYANTSLVSTDNVAIIDSGVGIYRSEGSAEGSLKLLNGIIRQGITENVSSGQQGGLNPIYLSAGEQIEIAGLSIDYHTAQTYGMFIKNARGNTNIHHNIFFDRGWEINDRHGSGGARSLYFSNAPSGENNFSVHHNLVKRTRQNAFHKAQNIYENEIYVDSWSTNSFAIQPNSVPDTVAGHISNNRIFLTGYHAIGISWAHLDLDVSGNFIHMQGINTENNRWYESFGDRNSLNGLRLTNYGKGGQIRDNLNYYNNLIIGTARNGSEMRGTELFSDYSVTNVSVADSVIKIESADAETRQLAAVVTQGTSSKESKPLYYRDSFLISDNNIIRFGDYYGKGYNHQFERCHLRRTGNNPDFHTFIFDGGYSRDGHVLLDTDFGKGTAYDDVYWERTGDLSGYTVMWTLTVLAEENTSVRITDVEGIEVFNGRIDENGKLQIPLTQAEIRPIEWSIDSTGSGVKEKSQHQKIMKTPHQIIINNISEQGKTIVMDQRRTINFLDKSPLNNNAAQCTTLDNVANLSFPCIIVGDVYIQASLNRINKHPVSDNGLMWQINSAEITEGMSQNSACTTIDEQLNMLVNCLIYENKEYNLLLNFFPNHQYSHQLFWELGTLIN